MKILSNFMLLLASLVCLTNTIDGKAQNSFSTQLGGNCFTLALPDYLTRTYQLNDVATLQYMNTDLEVYVLVIDDDKAQLEEYGAVFKDAKHFLDFFVKDYLLDAKNRTLSEPKTFTIRTNNFAQAELTWTDEGVNFFMLITTVETNNHLSRYSAGLLKKIAPNLKMISKKSPLH